MSLPLAAICLLFTLICACGAAPTLRGEPATAPGAPRGGHGACEGNSLSPHIDMALPAAFIRLNLAAPAIRTPAALDSILAAEAGLSRAERVGRWARRFLASGETVYRFGLAEGGYVAGGLIVDDRHLDCVSLMYRCSELAAARDHLQALELALSTRFAGASLDSLIDAGGRVDYERPEHLDYSLDMIRSGLWGRDITATLSGARLDVLGSARYPEESFHYLPEEALRETELREGDIVWCVLSTDHAIANALRVQHGLVIGHIGIIVMMEDKNAANEALIRETMVNEIAGDGGMRADERNARPWLIHAASTGLEDCYEGARVSAIPLAIYLQRVERFYGVIITRF